MGNILSNREARSDEPNLELVRRAGWSVRAVSGRYCVAWRGRDEEVVLVWQNGTWEQLTGRGHWRLVPPSRGGQEHDPTRGNHKRGPGDQYRSVVFVHDNEQRERALRSKAREQTRRSAPIVTQIEPARTFYEAEDRHQQYLEKQGRSTCTPALARAS